MSTTDTESDDGQPDDSALAQPAVRETVTTWLEDHDATVHAKPQLNRAAQSTLTENAAADIDLQSPDLLVTIDDTVIVVKIADGDDYSAVATAAYELFTHWNAYHAHNVWFQAEEKSPEPDLFVLATQYSPFGHICPNDHEFFFKHDISDHPERKLSRFEGNQSALIWRLLWRFAKGQEYETVSAGLGLLLSDTLDGFEDYNDTSDTYGMCRAAEIETRGRPAVQYWADDQYWDLLFTAPDTDSGANAEIDAYGDADT